MIKSTFEMLMPVRFSTTNGIFSMMSRTSPVTLAAPTDPLPDDTIVIFFVLLKGAEISAAIYNYKRNVKYYITDSFLFFPEKYF